MESVVRVNIRVRKYLWREFVYDVVNLMVYLLRWANALSWVFLHRSLLTLIRQSVKFVKKTFWIFMGLVWLYLFIAGALGWR